MRPMRGDGKGRSGINNGDGIQLLFVNGFTD
jgi:hypothetical protein